MTWRNTTRGTDAGEWSPHWNPGALSQLATVIIIGGTLGGAFEGTSSVAIAKPARYVLACNYTNAGPTRTQEVVLPFLNAEEVASTAPASVELSASAALIAELRRISGLTWQHVARLFDVDRRAVHFWASGRPLSDANAEHLSRLIVLLRQLDRGAPSKVREWLLAPTSTGAVPLDLLASKRYEDVPAPTLTGTAPKRAPRISTEAAAKRRPLPPQTLLQQELPVKQATPRLLASKPIKVKRNG